MSLPTRTDQKFLFVLGAIQLVETHTGAGGVQLQVKRRRLDRFLLVARQSGKAVSEGVGNSEIHTSPLTRSESEGKIVFANISCRFARSGKQQSILCVSKTPRPFVQPTDNVHAVRLLHSANHAQMKRSRCTADE